MATSEQLFADRYRLERRLGVGGMATVQLAFDTRLERNVAVKLLAEHLAEDSSFISRFRREALAAASASRRKRATKPSSAARCSASSLTAT